MSTSVLLNGIRRLPISARRPGLAAAAPELLPPVLHGAGYDEDRDDRSGREPHRDGVADLEVRVLRRMGEPRIERLLQEGFEVRGSTPAELLFGEVHPERR